MIPAPVVDASHLRPRDAAMPDDGRTHGDERGVRGRHDQGMSSSHRLPLSPPPAIPRPRDLDLESRRPRPRSRSVDRSQPGPGHRRSSRDTSRDRPRRRPAEPLPPRDRRADPRDRASGREADRPASSASGPPHSARPDRDPRLGRPRGRSRSPSSNKRPRSPSPSFSGGQPKKYRRDRSPPRHGAGAKPSRAPRDARPSPASPRHSRSPGRRDRRSKNGSKGSGSRASGSRRARSRSPSRDDDPNQESFPYPPRRRGSTRRDPSRSSFSSYRRRSPSRNRSRSPPLRGGRPPTASDTASRGRRSPDFDPYRHDPPHPPPRSPGDYRGPPPKNRGRGRDDPPYPRHPEPTSGVNSIEVNMSARGNFRGGYNGQAQAGFSTKGQYGQGHPNDPRGYSQSSGHATPNSSFHGSPPSQSPYGGSRGSWSGQQQYSPQSQYPPQYQQGNYPPPAGPQGHYQGSSHSHSPPYGTPTGPSSQQYPQGGSYRGGYRGGSSGSFRGGPFNQDRGGYRGGFKSGQWGPGAQGSNGPNQYSQPDEMESRPASPQSGPHPAGPVPENDDAAMEEADNPFRPSKDLQVEDTGRTEKDEADQMPPPDRPPPTGPQASKFSFAFKAASKPAVAAPKPEISQKFNAAPPRRDPYPSDDRGRDPRDSRDARDRRDSRDARDSRDYRDVRDARDRRDPRDSRGGHDSRPSRETLPRNVPTEPASSRAAKAEQRQRQEQGPRVRKVKKTMKRLKARPELPEDLAASTSVFFRKPGDGSVIGSGTYGKVFKALNVYTKKLVALKRIRMEGEKDGFPVTAVREIKLLQSLRHTNVVSLQEVMVEKNDCFMVFEYLSHDLTGILNHPTFKLDAAQRKHLAKQMFEGLDYLHKRGVLHRDIKAANILVSSDGILKLADFGLARFYAKRHQLDYTNRVITIWYRSPELLLGETQYGPAVDIWSAACVMVEIFTRHAIFPGDGGEINQLDKIYAVLGTPNRAEWPGLVDMPWFELLRPGYRKPDVFADKYRERLPAAAFDLLADMFRYDPAKRPSAAEVLEHPYFTTETPSPRQPVELSSLDGDWHEYESKALRRENERKEREARRAAAKDGAARDRDRKRSNEVGDSQREHKRQHVEKPAADKATIPAAAPAGGEAPPAAGPGPSSGDV